MIGMLNCSGAAQLLKGWDTVLVVSHASPDGDTLGSAAALVRGLQALGKQVNFCCPDEVPEKYAYLFQGIVPEPAEQAHVVTVDVADCRLLGQLSDTLGSRTELSIDHHGTHVAFAPCQWVEPESAATTEMIFQLLQELGVSMDPAMADCIYTGLTTDTGCFRYGSVTPRTHRIAAEVIELGARAGEINRIMFESKSREQVEAERQVRESMRFYHDGKCAVIEVPQWLLQETGATESDLDGVAAMPRQIVGVIIGATLKEKENGEIKASLRTNAPADAAVLAGKFGGGGHKAAAGCSLRGCTMEEARERLMAACGAYLKEIGA